MNGVWCPWCHNFVSSGVFLDDKCPMCRKSVAEGEALWESPFKQKQEQKRKSQDTKKKEFRFDQKNGSSTGADPTLVPAMKIESY